MFIFHSYVGTPIYTCVLSIEYINIEKCNTEYCEVIWKPSAITLIGIPEECRRSKCSRKKKKINNKTENKLTLPIDFWRYRVV